MKMNYRMKQCIAVVSAAALLFSGVELSGVSQAAAKPKLNKKKVTIRVGGKVRLKLKHAKKKVTWKSSKKKVAVVSKKGLVKGKSKGVAKIVAKCAGKKYTCRVTVKAKAESAVDTATIGPDGTVPPTASQTASPKKTEAPATTTTAAPGTTATSGSGGLTEGTHTLADASEGLTVTADSGVYSFKLGQTATEITTGFGEPARKDKSPQGYEVYVYYNTYASYFQVYIDNGIVVGAATMSSGFNYKNIVSQGAAASALTGFSSLPSKYYYQDAYYRETDSEYISVYLDSYGTVGTKGVYAVQVFSTTNGSGEAVAMDDLYMGNSISDNGGYSDAKVLSDMAAEIFDWGCAFRVSKGLASFQKFTIDNIGDTVAQSLSDYNATTGTSDMTDSSGRGLKERFTQEYAIPGGWDDYYVAAEIVEDASPDALGYFVYSINSSTDEKKNKTNYENITKTKNTKEDIEIGPYYLCVGVSFSSAKKATFAVMDMFSLE